MTQSTLEFRTKTAEKRCGRPKAGFIDAGLGGLLIKQRIPRRGQGASKGLRAIVFYNRGDIAVFLHIFPKSDKANLSKSEPIKDIRERSNMSQATFALALNVTKVLVSKWERGEVRPGGPSLKLLALAGKKGIGAIL